MDGTARKKFRGIQISRTASHWSLHCGFLLSDEKLVIEVDGGQHLDQQDEDDQRIFFLESMGVYVMRFWNDEVLNRMDDVCDHIVQALHER